jgi:RNA polymerase-interacting CarD/CdnL/TRCF family regulator
MFGWFGRKPKIPEEMIQLREPPTGGDGAPTWNEEIQSATHRLGPEFLAPFMFETSPGQCLGGFVAKAKLDTPARTYEARAVLIQRRDDEFRTSVVVTAPGVGENLAADHPWPPYKFQYNTSLPKEHVRDTINTIRGLCASSHAEQLLTRENIRRPIEQIVTEPTKEPRERHCFKVNEFVVYPAHGVGQILAIEEQEIAGTNLELFVINFKKDKMTLRVPTTKVVNVGMRKLSEPALVERALDTVKGRAHIERGRWSDRAHQYETKINSGDIIAIAEVVRDLFHPRAQTEQSYSERQIYEAALDRLSREIAVVQNVTAAEAANKIARLRCQG